MSRALSLCLNPMRCKRCRVWNKRTMSCCTVVVFALICRSATDEPDLRRLMLADIQSAMTARQPSVWGSFEGNYQVALEWQLDGFNGPLQFRRQVRRSPDGGVTLTETWNMAPLDLGRLCAGWGHPDAVTWESLEGVLTNGRVIAESRSGTLIILREFPIHTDLRRVMPFPLDALPTTQHPDLTYQDRLNPKNGSRFASFLSEVFLDEVLDSDGVPISLSQRWHFEGRFSRFSPFVRVERRIRLDLSGTYSVFDIYTVGTEFLLGNREDEEDTVVEEGAFLEVDKKVVVIRDGYQRWYDALFTKWIPLRDLPYSSQSFQRMPVGIRVVYPSTTGITLAEKRKKPTGLGDMYPWKLDTFLGLRGTFFVSVSKHSSQQVELRFGGRVERLLELDTRVRPDFDGPLDPLRLAFGSIALIRAKRAFGTRLFMQRLIDLNDEEQLALAHQALSRGVRINGIAIGAVAAVNFSFKRDIDEFLVDRFIRGQLPDFQWDRAVLSRYDLAENYGKLGVRAINARSRTTRVDDDWSIELLDSSDVVSGRAIELATRRQFRVLDLTERRTTHLRALVQDGEFDRGDAFIELVDLREDERMSYDEYQTIQRRLARCLGDHVDRADLAWEPQSVFHNAQIGYRLVLNKKAIAQLSHALIDAKASKQDPLGRWLRFHPILFRRVKKADHDPDKFFAAANRLLFKMARSGAPLSNLLSRLPEDSYRLEWRNRGDNLPDGFAATGGPHLDAAMLEAWHTWETISVMDDLFVEQSFQARAR